MNFKIFGWRLSATDAEATDNATVGVTAVLMDGAITEIVLVVREIPPVGTSLTRIFLFRTGIFEIVEDIPASTEDSAGEFMNDLSGKFTKIPDTWTEDKAKKINLREHGCGGGEFLNL
ncbi:unnamed protein product [Allacma fusca]|uniref:Uncharacterized protein n=1 Tax=Allacma fusca TaxID=39272 RepID=A0A8J2KKZ9_9HEXA|nr:unnamed protein product [Allacma fusca]